MLISLLAYPRAGLCHYIFSTSLRTSSPSIISILPNIMTLSNVLFLRALLFLALSTICLVAGTLVPRDCSPIETKKNYLAKYTPWIREVQHGVSGFLLFF